MPGMLTRDAAKALIAQGFGEGNVAARDAWKYSVFAAVFQQPGIDWSERFASLRRHLTLVRRTSQRGTKNVGRRINEGRGGGARLQRPDRRLEVRRRDDHRIGGHAVRGPALGRRYRKSWPVAAGHEEVPPARRHPPSVRLQQGTLFLEFRRRHPAVFDGRGGVDLRGRAEV